MIRDLQWEEDMRLLGGRNSLDGTETSEEDHENGIAELLSTPRCRSPDMELGRFARSQGGDDIFEALKDLSARHKRHGS